MATILLFHPFTSSVVSLLCQTSPSLSHFMFVCVCLLLSQRFTFLSFPYNSVFLYYPLFHDTLVPARSAWEMSFPCIIFFYPGFFFLCFFLYYVISMCFLYLTVYFYHCACLALFLVFVFKFIWNKIGILQIVDDISGL